MSCYECREFLNVFCYIGHNRHFPTSFIKCYIDTKTYNTTYSMPCIDLNIFGDADKTCSIDLETI